MPPVSRSTYALVQVRLSFVRRLRRALFRYSFAFLFYARQTCVLPFDFSFPDIAIVVNVRRGFRQQGNVTSFDVGADTFYIELYKFSKGAALVL